MIGNKKIEQQFFLPFRSGLANFFTHIICLALITLGLSYILSLSIRSYGFSKVYQETFSDIERYSLQSQLFDLRKQNHSNRVLLVGSTGFFDEVFSLDASELCKEKFVQLDVPDYALKYISPKFKLNGEVSYYQTDFKDIVFENSADLWTELATEPSTSKLDLWNRLNSLDSMLFNKKDISTFFKYSQETLKQKFNPDRNAVRRAFNRSLPFYSFSSGKLERIKVRGDGAVKLFLNPKKPDFISYSEFEKFSTYFNTIDRTSQSVPVNPMSDSSELKDLVGC